MLDPCVLYRQEPQLAAPASRCSDRLPERSRGRLTSLPRERVGDTDDLSDALDRSHLGDAVELQDETPDLSSFRDYEGAPLAGIDLLSVLIHEQEHAQALGRWHQSGLIVQAEAETGAEAKAGVAETEAETGAEAQARELPNDPPPRTVPARGQRKFDLANLEQRLRGGLIRRVRDLPGSPNPCATYRRVWRRGEAPVRGSPRPAIFSSSSLFDSCPPWRGRAFPRPARPRRKPGSLALALLLIPLTFATNP